MNLPDLPDLPNLPIPASTVESNVALQALAQGDFSFYAERFLAAGLAVQQPATGMMQIHPSAKSTPANLTKRVLISVGVHGDETGPIEMLQQLLNQLLEQLAHTPTLLAADLLLIVGNPAAIVQGRRYVDADLNRMFSQERGDLGQAQEAGRADQIMQAAQDFFAECAISGGQAWHLDLHSTIRPSHIATFAIVPTTIEQAAFDALCSWLGQAAVDAIILNPTNAATFSSFTASHCGASSATVELGQIGQNNLNQLAPMRRALMRLLCSDPGGSGVRFNQPQRFRVTQQIMKLSDAFAMKCNADIWNFTPLSRGTLIAQDGAHLYAVREAVEYILFPNPNVVIGQRAGLMVVSVIAGNMGV
ncbi:MAG: succinylglutamate desuccinylase [Pseudomonadota bacterium]